MTGSLHGRVPRAPKTQKISEVAGIFGNFGAGDVVADQKKELRLKSPLSVLLPGKVCKGERMSQN